MKKSIMRSCEMLKVFNMSDIRSWEPSHFVLETV